MQDGMKQYLLSLQISDEDKRYALNFCKKLDYLEKLRSKAAHDTNLNVHAGYGSLNSNIFFIFNSHKVFMAAKSIIQEKLDLFDINFWQIYVTFVNKFEQDYQLKYDMICAEISAVKPKLLYVFDNDKSNYDNIMDSMIRLNVSIPERIFFVDIAELISDDEEVKKKIWHTLRYLINYKSL